MDLSPRCLRNLTIGYVVIGFLTWGWNVNHWPCSADNPNLTPRERMEANDYTCSNDRAAGSFFSGLGWPIFFAGKFTLMVTRWP